SLTSNVPADRARRSPRRCRPWRAPERSPHRSRRPRSFVGGATCRAGAPWARTRSTAIPHCPRDRIILHPDVALGVDSDLSVRRERLRERNLREQAGVDGSPRLPRARESLSLERIDVPAVDAPRRKRSPHEPIELPLARVPLDLVGRLAGKEEMVASGRDPRTPPEGGTVYRTLRAFSSERTYRSASMISPCVARRRPSRSERYKVAVIRCTPSGLEGSKIRAEDTSRDPPITPIGRGKPSSPGSSWKERTNSPAGPNTDARLRFQSKARIESAGNAPIPMRVRNSPGPSPVRPTVTMCVPLASYRQERPQRRRSG